MDNFEERYKALSFEEKYVINHTSLSIEDIDSYEKNLNRKLSERELKIAGILRDNGIILNENDFLVNTKSVTIRGKKIIISKYVYYKYKNLYVKNLL